MRLLYQLDTAKMLDHMIDRDMEQLKEGMIREGIRSMGLDKKADGIEVVVNSYQREALRLRRETGARHEGYREQARGATSISTSPLRRPRLRASRTTRSSGPLRPSGTGSTSPASASASR